MLALAASPVDGEKLFLERVYPVMKDKCFACHGDDPKKVRGKLDMRTRKALIEGGDSGTPSLMPGDPEGSPLYIAVTRKDDELVMPPKDNDKLSGPQVDAIRDWILAGAPWPADADKRAVKKWDDVGPAGVTVATSGGRSADWTERKYLPADIWAYQPIRKPAVPSGAAHPIDSFVRAKLKDKGITRVAPPAERRTLLRRATIDLTGLPPTEKDDGAAFETVIDRLLASPRYGEQWARHWLDVSRYADTSGFANDYERPNAWRYRDYVVRSFNADKPYDRFVLEQVAGDEIDPADPEMLIATGFLRMGPWEHTAMTVAAVTRQQFLDDVTHHVGVTLLGQGLRCAQCHDHKFDPIPTRDYYGIQAVFGSTQFADRTAPFVPAENVASLAAGKENTQLRLGEVRRRKQVINARQEVAVAAFLKARGVEKITDIPLAERDNAGQLGLTKDDLTLRKLLNQQDEYLSRELLRYEAFAFSVYAGPLREYTSKKVLNEMPGKMVGTVPVVHILPNGSIESPADAVVPGVLSAVSGALAYKVPDTTAGRRLAFARWVASRENTLTARVIVNRVWQYHFGRGLVATANNFGKMGGKPTHPELLDWLATWLMDNGWSLKKLHKLIMTSATYQQGGVHPDLAKLREIDARNELNAYFTPRRMEAEEVRDGMLAVTGELSPERGGPGVFPEINWEVALQPRHVMGAVAPSYQPSRTPDERNRRTLYTYRYRTLNDPLLEVFNRPGSDISCERRDETTVTPQVFGLFNSEYVHDRALALAIALQGKPRPVAEAFQRAYGRAPTVDEGRAAAAHVTKMTKHHQAHPAKPRPVPKTVKRNMVEEMTGENIVWEETLDLMDGYERDKKAWDVGPQTRALADLCLVLFNSNEFLYVR